MPQELDPRNPDFIGIIRSGDHIIVWGRRGSGEPQPLAERVPRMIAIAHSDFREALERDAHEMLRRGAF
jgi:hypothetical protein